MTDDQARKHSPTPWKYDHEECCIFDGDYYVAAGLGMGSTPNMTFIVHCVNLHDELVAALELAHEWLDEVCNPRNGEMRSDEGMAVDKRIREVLAKAKVNDD